MIAGYRDTRSEFLGRVTVSQQDRMAILTKVPKSHLRIVAYVVSESSRITTPSLDLIWLAGKGLRRQRLDSCSQVCTPFEVPFEIGHSNQKENNPRFITFEGANNEET